jgi:hypothetical protein
MTRTTKSRFEILRQGLKLVLFIGTFTLLPLACDRDRSDDHDVDEAVEDTKDAVEEAGDEVKDAVEEAGDEVKDAVDD